MAPAEACHRAPGIPVTPRAAPARRGSPRQGHGGGTGHEGDTRPPWTRDGPCQHGPKAGWRTTTGLKYFDVAIIKRTLFPDTQHAIVLWAITAGVL